MEDQKLTKIPVTPIDGPIPVEPDFPIGGPTPEATIQIEGSPKKAQARTSAESIIPAANRIEGTDNPEILFTTPGDDLVLAKGGNDTIFGSLGNDTYSGGDGFDSLDYSLLGKKITLLPRGFVGNGDTQGSQIQEIERIVGAPNKDNAIDGSGGRRTKTSFNINLAQEKLVVENLPGGGSFKFEVENFVNIEGTENDDSLTGNDKRNRISGNGGNDVLIGGLESDTLFGGSGNDTLTGSDPTVSQTPGSERDELTGGSGIDKFILGNEKGSFYDDFTSNDFARITDFTFGETIQLSTQATYNIEQSSNGFNVFLVKDSGKDVIAKVTVSLGISSARSAALTTDAALTTESAVSSLLTGIPEGDFTINSGEQKGVFVA
ncbi:putative calcium-binding protein [Rivularia sp. PCC 7116]|uniref:calcium-binding protein n=1 Tax=Rivularia sp. PCC 7116 TaxID=373994 RepID=UPI00029EDC62|nr:calcium-binding protein [Rivularia sp. PCC 7116]AFY57974.1 putative calcium-binding protein [Rivularia sp. PCC 7116]